MSRQESIWIDPEKRCTECATAMATNGKIHWCANEECEKCGFLIDCNRILDRATDK